MDWTRLFPVVSANIQRPDHDPLLLFDARHDHQHRPKFDPHGLAFVERQRNGGRNIRIPRT